RRNLVKKLLPFFYRYKKQMALVFLTVFLSGLLSVVVPYLKSKVLYDEILTPGTSLYGKVGFLVLSVAGAGLLSAFVTMINSIIGSRVSAFVTYDLKKTIFSSFERLSYSFFTSRHTGRLITQINSDAETLYWFFCDGIPYLLTNVLQMLVIAIVMFSIHPLLTLVVLVPIPLLFLGYVLVLRMFRRLHAENHTHRSRFNSVLSDVLGGMRIVKAFSRENEEIARFDQKSQNLYSSKLAIDIRHHTIFPLLNLGMRMTNYLVWGFGGYFVLREMMTPGSGISYGVLNLFISYLTMLYTPLNFFANFLSQLAGGLNALQRLFEILETEPEVKEKKDAIDLPNIKGSVEFDRVSFSYQPGKKAIDHVSFAVPAGKTLGIVGHSGAGKSTLVNLLTRLYDVSDGAIRIDGKDVRDLSLATLRRHVAIVSQETYLFRGTIMDNIRYANPDASEEEVLRASRAAGCHDFIMALPDGYETYVGTDKRTLSGGEKQRISIARAILKDPAILILDEATAAMDTKTERRIQVSLNAITQNRTTITIAHRLSTIRDADFLIVIEEGKKVEEGTHEELLKKEGVYHKLYRLQMEALKIIGIEE
ncbi:MAG: ABC transporter ATP-binding protein, partial [Clostridia bacterium]|nr:ABC transporter ATP-binding protein [Clostridia bacterium]